MNFTLPDPGPPNTDFEKPADLDRLRRVVTALQQQGFNAQLANSLGHARQLALDMIPEGSEVYAAPSETLNSLGLSTEIDESGRFQAVRVRLRSLDRRSREYRVLSAAPEFIVGSAHAITDSGHIIVASGTGRQLGAYAYAAATVILVVGRQKIVKDIAEGLRRVREYSLPREFLRMREAGHPGSVWSETLLLHFDPAQRVRVIIVPESLGY